MPAKNKFFREIIKDEHASIIILALLTSVVVAMISSSFGLMIQNEMNRQVRINDYDRALYVAEAGLQDILFQRSLAPSQDCFPFGLYNSATAPANLDNGNDLLDVGVLDTPDTYCPNFLDKNANLSSACRPYDEELAADAGVSSTGKPTHFPPFKCNSGVDPDRCSTYRPLGRWPVDTSGNWAWKKYSDPLGGKANLNDKERYSVGLFTLCSDDFESVPYTTDPADPQYGAVCADAVRVGGLCPQMFYRFSIVSIGSVRSAGGQDIRRSVKIDLTVPGLYAGIIDRYIDFTLTGHFNWEGPLHVNGWQFLRNGSLVWDWATGKDYGLSTIGSWMLDPPETISVSYPEDPDNPDPTQFCIWNTSICSGNIKFVHVPVRIDIPSINWKTFEDPMSDLYNNPPGNTHNLALQADQPNFGGDWERLVDDDDDPDGGSDWSCPRNAGGFRNDANASTCMAGDACPPGQEFEIFFGLYKKCLYHVEEGEDAADAGCAPAGAGKNENRIHSCRKDYRLWGDVVVDKMDVNQPAGSFDANRTNSGASHTGGGNRIGGSLPDATEKRIYPSLSNPGCSFSDIMSCFQKMVPVAQFAFMGQHTFQDRVVIDGTIALGRATPYHTCAIDDNAPTWDCWFNGFFDPNLSPLIDGDIPLVFGIPWYHQGKIKVEGEMLVWGKLFLEDYIEIDGGAIYAKNDITKRDTSGFGLNLNLANAFCSLLGFSGIGGTLCNLIVTAILTPILSAFGLSIEISLSDIFSAMGWDWYDMSLRIMNRGILYTRGSFIYEPPPFSVFMFIFNTLLGYLIGFGGFKIYPETDPVVLSSYSTIAARNDVILGNNERIDLLICDNYDSGSHSCSDTDANAGVGFALAGGNLQIYSDIGRSWVSSGNWWETGSPVAKETAAGIFYGGSKFTSEGCPPFSEDSIGALMCFGSAVIGYKWSKWNMQGHVFAGEVSGIPLMTEWKLTTDPNVKTAALNESILKVGDVIGKPVDWLEVIPPEPRELPALQ